MIYCQSADDGLAIASPQQERIVNCADKPRGRIQEIIDEIHTLISLGDSDRGIGINNILKPYLTDPKLQFIGATTNNEAETLLQDEAFQRRFTIVKLKELNLENLKKFLKTILTRLILSYQDLQKMN